MTHLVKHSALDGDEWLASRPGRFTLEKRSTGTHWTGGWVGLRVGLNAVATTERSPCPCRDSNPGLRPI